MAVPHTSGTSLAWANPLQHQSLDPSSQLQLLTTPPQTSQHGLVLSPSSPPIPQKLVEKVREGRFVDMKEFLTDNMVLVSQLEAVPGTSQLMGLTVGAVRPRLREIASIATWCYCFMGYMAIQTRDPVTRDQLAYGRLLISEARRHGGLGWVDYDRAFRQQLAANPTLPWNSLVPGLQASTLLGQRAGQGMFCTLCRGVDHTQARYALYCLQPPASSPRPGPWDPNLPASKPREICISWNRGACIFPKGQCSYSHVCPSCNVTTHRARDCDKVSEESKYKRRLGPTRIPATTTTA